MKLEEIGFYTLTDHRAANTSLHSDLQRCELILTDDCNFKCPYCRGIRDDYKGSLSLADAKRIVGLWTDDNLRNIRFSGGEPTMWPDLEELVQYTASRGVKRIALSTNGSADLEYYLRLYRAGVSDFSISLDACCASDGDKMAGGINGVWKKLTDNIRELAKITYVTVGVVVTANNISNVREIVNFAKDNLGVSDIRVISAAQRGQKNDGLNGILDDHDLPILKYRIGNVCSGRGVRGLNPEDPHSCPLMLDDMAVLGTDHFPCIIYMREGGNPVGSTIGKSIEEIRRDRLDWIKNTDTQLDPICRGNCLDVCVDYNKKVLELNVGYDELLK